MKTRISLQFCLLFAAASMIAGCGSGGTTAPVSGTVTLDGKPLVGIEVVFSPMAVEGNSNVGPYSFGLTDADGHYELKTRYGKTGAIIGKHIATFEYPGEDPEEEMEELEELREELEEAESKEEADEIKAQIAEAAESRKAKTGRPKIPASAQQEVEVAAGGNTSADFELGKK